MFCVGVEEEIEDWMDHLQELKGRFGVWGTMNNILTTFHPTRLQEHPSVRTNKTTVILISQKKKKKKNRS